MWPRVVPFALYMGFVAVSEVGQGWLLDQQMLLWMYPIKISLVAIALGVFWRQYHEFDQPVIQRWSEGLYVIGVGLLVYGLWIQMDWPWAIQGAVTEYNPFLAGRAHGMALAAFRVVGAVAIVPIMEELFWRSFLIRWIIDTRFERIPLGKFTPASFAITVIGFGLEHNLWVAGMIAGMAYNVVLYRTRRLWPCVLAHAVTNCALGIHVLITEEWKWW